MDKPYGILTKISKYAFFWLRSMNRHDVHSPFVFDFVESILNENHKDMEVEIEREKLLQNHAQLFLEDHGVGNSRNTSVAKIASNSLKKAKEASILSRIIKHYSIKNVIEFGTSLGITTSYMARADSNVKVKSIEGSAETLTVARSVWKNLNLNSIESFQIDFDSYLSKNNESRYTNTLVFIDGNHKYNPTIKYFKHFLNRCGDDCILVFDDIHWSKEMEKAWNEIIANKDIFLSLDLFEMGIVFLDKRVVKEHFNLRY